MCAAVGGIARLDAICDISEGIPIMLLVLFHEIACWTPCCFGELGSGRGRGDGCGTASVGTRCWKIGVINRAG
jgi:hypothetical protein